MKMEMKIIKMNVFMAMNKYIISSQYIQYLNALNS